MAVELRRKFKKLRDSRDVFGLAGGLKVLLHSKLRFAPWDLFSLQIPGVQHEVYGRTRTSDPWVLQQIFLDHEYAPIDDEEHVSFVLDCGANVGYSSIYFLNRFPGCRVLAVEPDIESVSLLRKNLEPYGQRAQVVAAGVWSRPTALVLVRNDEAWTTRVRAARPDETGDLEGVDIPTLLRYSGFDHIDVLKMDIEGSEAEVFSGDVGCWLSSVRTLVLEIHDDRSSSIVHGAIADYDCRKCTSGELWIFRDIKRQPSR